MRKSKSKLKDPLTSIPIETFTTIFRFLPLSSIATSQVSRSWRQALLSDPTLYTEVDASNFFLAEDVCALLYHLNRWSILSNHRIVKLTLNLDPCLEEANYGENKEGSATGFDALLLALTNMKLSLKELFVKSSDEGTTTRRETSDLLIPLLQHLSDFPKIKKIEIVAPSPVSFIVGDEAGMSRCFSIKDNHDCDYGDETDALQSSIRELMRIGVAFAGHQFKAFTVSESDKLSHPIRSDILQVLMKSRDTLHSLDLESYTCFRNGFEEQYLDFALSCPHLTSLALNVTRYGGAAGILRFPTHSSRSSEFKELVFKTSGVEIDSDSFIKWIGKSLEKLELEVACFTDHSTAMDFGSFTSILSNSEHTLRSLVLDAMYYSEIDEDSEADEESERRLEDFSSFTNLESLSIRNLNSHLYGFFSRSKYPKLISLSVTEVGCEDHEACLPCLFSILENFGSRLTQLSLNIKFPEGYRPQAPLDLKLQFPKLESLVLADVRSQALVQWLSRISYPSLTSLNLGSEHKRFFQQFSKDNNLKEEVVKDSIIQSEDK